MGINYFHQTFEERNRSERWFRTLKERTKRFYNNINSKTVGSIEEMAAAIGLIHNLNLNHQRWRYYLLTVPCETIKWIVPG